MTGQVDNQLGREEPIIGELLRCQHRCVVSITSVGGFPSGQKSRSLRGLSRLRPVEVFGYADDGAIVILKPVQGGNPTTVMVDEKRSVLLSGELEVRVTVSGFRELIR